MCAIAGCSQADRSVSPTSTLPPRKAALAACTDANAALDLIRQNARADKVRAQLRSATDEATSAAQQDSTYYPLRGAIQSLKVALEGDSAQDAQTAVDAIQVHCAAVTRGGAPPIPGATG